MEVKVSLQILIQRPLSTEAAALVERQNLQGAKIPSWWLDRTPCPDDDDDPFEGISEPHAPA